MNRKSFLQKTFFASTLLVFSKYEGFAKMLSKVGFTIEMLTDDIGIFNEKGGTILFYTGKRGITIVDTQFPESVANLIKSLKDKGKEKFELLINTHHHGDHTSGNIAFKDLIQTIVAHENSAINQKTAAIKQKTEGKQLYPNTTFTDKWNKKIGKEKVVMHYFGAGHTNGDSIVHFTKSNVVHVGDLVFNRRYPYIDKGNGANIKSWITVLQKIQTTFNEETKFVCGHARDGYKVVVNKADIKAFESYLSELLLFVTAEVKAGKTKEVILKTKSIPNAPEWTGDGIERSLTAAYAEIVEEK